MKYDKKELVKFAERRFEKSLQWNGRQHRNAFQTAIALAEYQANEKGDKGDEGTTAPYLGLEQFRTIAKATKIFDKYLFEMDNASEDTRAAQRLNRTNPKKLSMKTTIDSDETSGEESQHSSEESDEDSDARSEAASPRSKKKKPAVKISEAKKVSTPKKHSGSDAAKKEKSKAKSKKYHGGNKKGKAKQEEDSEEERSSQNSDQQPSSDEEEN